MKTNYILIAILVLAFSIAGAAQTVIVTPARTVPARFQRTVGASADIMAGRLPVQVQLVLPAGELTTGSARVAIEGSKERRTGKEPRVDGKRVLLDLGRPVRHVLYPTAPTRRGRRSA